MTWRKNMRTIALLSTASILTLGSAALADAWVGFDDGETQGWVGPSGFGGITVVEETGGNPGWNMHTTFSDFGITFFNNTNPEFVQDLSGYDNVTFSVDLKVEDISFIGNPLSRPFLIELRDYDAAPSGYPWASVWYLFDWVDSTNYGDWTTLAVTIEDTNATELPDGWGGYGAEDPDTFEPMLPDGVTFADIVAGYDEVVYSTFQPGFFFSTADFDVRLDNIGIVVPAPASATLLGLAAFLGRRRSS
jgi:hypothetical protein